MAVGVFDSGLGGLTVLDALTRRLPDVPFVYLGDNANTPYGTRDADDIYQLTCTGVSRLFDEGCDLVILACNTASAAALKRMQERWVPEGKRVLGVFVPLIEALTERQWGDNSPPREVALRHVALFATPATVASRAFQRELAFRAIGVDVEAQPCGGVVDAIEQGDMILAEALVHSHVEALHRRMPRPQAAVLGCTHYPLVEAAFRAALGPDVAVFSQPELVAASLDDYLRRRPEMLGPEMLGPEMLGPEMLGPEMLGPEIQDREILHQGSEAKFLTTGDPVAVGHKATIFLRRKIGFDPA